MRRHMTMDQLARDVFEAAAVSTVTKVASASEYRSDLATLLSKVASEIRNTEMDTLTYADIVKVAEARYGQR